MAPLPIIADTYRVAFVTDSNASVNVMHFHKSGGFPIDIFNDINASVNANMWKVWLGFLHVRQLFITPLGTAAATVVYDTDGSSKWGGSATGSEHVPSASAVVSFKTAERGRRARGRAFIGPVAESELQNGLLNDTTRAAMVTGWTTFQTNLISHDTEHVVASYTDRTALTILQYSIRRPAGTLRMRHNRDTGV